MKAYKVFDKSGYYDCATVVFAETAGKAKAVAINTEWMIMSAVVQIVRLKMFV